MIGVYALLFQNDKVYIGSTSKSFESRRYEHLNNLVKQKHHNKHVQRTYQMYGEPEFLILE